MNSAQQPPRAPRKFGEVEYDTIAPAQSPAEMAQAPAGGGKRPGPTSAGPYPIQLKLRMSQDSAAVIKGAYVASADLDPDPATTFADWIARVVDEHAGRTPQRRAQLAKDLTFEAITREDSQNRGFKIPTSTWARIDEACAADRKVGRAHGRTSFGQEAVAVAVQQVKAAKEAAGERFIPFYGRLPRTLR